MLNEKTPARMTPVRREREVFLKLANREFKMDKS
jgi:hypothetical protein